MMITRELEVQTERLLLIASSAQVARAAAVSRRHAEALLGWRVPPEWPGIDIRGYLPIYARQLTEDPTLLGWGLWLIIHRDTRQVIGDAGFKGKPDGRGAVDIGYGVITAFRRQGYAFEAARALTDWALAQQGVRCVTADCLPENAGSVRILEKLGMRRIGYSEDGLLLWELRS